MNPKTKEFLILIDRILRRIIALPFLLIATASAGICDFIMGMGEEEE